MEMVPRAEQHREIPTDRYYGGAVYRATPSCTRANTIWLCSGWRKPPVRRSSIIARQR